MVRDQRGFLWIGTGYGLNRFDGRKIVTYHHQPDRPEAGPAGDSIRDLVLDVSGKIWIATDGGVSCLNPLTEVFEHFPLVENGKQSIAEKLLFRQKMLWVGTKQGLFHLDPGTKHAVELTKGDEAGSSFVEVTSLIADPYRQGLWVGFKEGLAFFPEGTSTPSQILTISGDVLSFTWEGERLWIGMRATGLWYLDLEMEMPQKEESEFQTVYALATDKGGNFWVATWGQGLYRRESWVDPPARLRADQNEYQNFRSRPDRAGSLSHDTIYTILTDRTEGSNTVWVGTNGGGFSRFKAESEAFTYWRVGGETERNVLSAPVVLPILEDRWGFLWVGCFDGGLNRIDRLTGRVERFKHDPNNEKTLPDNTPMVLVEDKRERLWVSSNKGLSYINRDLDVVRVKVQGSTYALDLRYEGGELILYYGGTRFINIFRPETGEEKSIDPFSSAIESAPGSSKFIYILKVLGENLWAGTGDGLFQLNLVGDVLQHYPSVPRDVHSMPHPTVLSVQQDSKDSNLLWVGTRSGLVALNPTTRDLKVYRAIDGFSDDTIYCLQQDSKGFLWMSTNDGIVRFDTQTERFKIYGQEEGLPFSEFNNFASAKGRDGILYFGGIQGMISFRPENLWLEAPPPKLALTSLLVNGEVQTMSRLDLSQNPPALALAYTQDRVDIGFASLDFSRSGFKRYAYKLDGWDRDWIYSSEPGPKAIYTRLDPGNYTFRFKGTNRDGIWSEDEQAMAIHLSAPPWRSRSAIVVYILFLVAVLGQVWRNQQKHLLSAQETNTKLREMDQLKDQFLANTSHELRTPVHGIIGLAESMLDPQDRTLPEGTRKNLEMMVVCGKRLAGLLDDILDFSQLEQQETFLELGPVSLYCLVEDTLSLLEPLARPKRLTIENGIDKNLSAVHGDESRLNQVFLNLVGNSIKFTESGKVVVSAREDGDVIQVSVADTGIGIDPIVQDHIFDAFRQADGHTRRLYGGTGLGLSICSQLISLHGGKIWVESVLGEGSTFHFTLPRSHREAHSKTNRQAISTNSLMFDDIEESGKISPPQPLTISGIESHRILVVDDDPINRQVLRNHLTAAGYLLTETGDGEDVVELIEQQSFDLVLLDLMMPKISGIDVCKQLRKKYTATELPVIFLSARQQEKDRVDGLAVGANDYLTKPISKDELLMRIRNQLRLLEGARDLERLVKIRTRALREAHDELARAAHLAGMGELAAEMIHRLGNTLNSFSTSLQLVEELTVDDKALNLVTRLNHWLGDGDTNGGPDLSGLPEQTRSQLASVMSKLKERMVQRSTTLDDEMGRIRGYSKELQAILHQQQEYAREREPLEMVNLHRLVHDGLGMEETALTQSDISVIRDLKETSPAMLAPQRFSRVFAYLLDNARQALEASRGEEPGRIVVRTLDEQEHVVLTIEDNGIGFSESQKERLFVLGFSTRKGARGFGLHYCANAVTEMHGKIQIESGGQEQGATVRLLFPKA